jgi:hypothetical protein
MKKKQNKMTDIPESGLSETTVPDAGIRERIASKAFELYEKRGCSHGLDVQDWVEAEGLVLAEIKKEAGSRKVQSAAEPESKVRAAMRQRDEAKPGAILGRS